MKWLADLLKNYPALNVAHERLALFEQKYELLQQQNETLRLDNAELKRELETLRRQVPSSQFVEARGVLFKRRADGSFNPDAYCPDCKTVLVASEPSVLPPECRKCRFMAPFRQHEIPMILAELDKP